MELRHLRYFIAVAEEMNIHKAAKRLNISQPPLSLTIKNLEQEIGTDLFKREGRGITITRAGKQFLEQAKNIVYEVETAKQDAHLIGVGKKGILKIGFISSAVTGILQDIISNFRQEQPDIHLTMSQSVNNLLSKKVLSSEYDIGLLRLPEHFPEGLIIHEMKKESWSIACHKTHSLSKKKIITFKDLEKEDLIFYPRHNSSAGYDDMMQLFKHHGVIPNIIQEATEQMTIAGLVTSGIGIGIVPTCMSKIPMKNLVHKPLKDTKNRTGFAIIHRHEPDEIVNCFIKTLNPPPENHYLS